jgi:hypothetical protein
MTRSGAPDHRAKGPLALAGLLPELTKPALAKRSRAEATLILDWDRIVGEDTGCKTRPRRLSFPDTRVRRQGILHLAVDPSYALDLEHNHPQVIERINRYFGYALVARLKLRQEPLPGKPPRRRPRPPDLPAEERREIAQSLEGIENDGLRDALARLAEAIRAKARESGERGT